MQHQLVTTPLRKGPPAPRPSRSQIEPAALALLSRHSAGLLATARRYSITPEDAEDAYQRGVEILLTRAPTTSEDELLPWLKTVVKHEAFAVRKSTARLMPADFTDAEPAADGGAAWTDERSERYEQLRLGAEAMAGLKPQEIRCLLLKAEGLSYQEICRVTGFSYTKVNRCLTEGRRAFLQRVARIESGAECERLQPLISKVADGEASPEEMRTVRPHLKGCLACKATLREYRATPTRLAGLVPPVVAMAGSGGDVGFVARAIASFHERFGGMSDVATAKLAVVASAVVLAGGGAAGAGALHHDPPAVPDAAFAADAPARASTALASAAPVRPEAAVQAPAASGAPAPAPSTALDRAGSERGTDPAPEFDPGTSGAGGSGSEAYPQPGEFASTPASAPPSGSGSPSGSAPAAEFGAPTASAPAAGTGSASRSVPSGGGSAEFGP